MGDLTVERNLTEKEKMVLGLPYDAMQDRELVGLRLRARKLLKAYNVSSESDSKSFTLHP